MKRFFLGAALTLGFALSGAAQTDFRHISFDEALTAAKSEGKLVFIDFYTSWCGPCKRLAREVFPDKKVGDYMNSNFVCLKLDAEKEGAELAKKFNVSAYPTLVVVGTDGNAISSFAGFKEGPQFIAAVDALKDPELNPERVKERYLAGERDSKLVFTYANQLMENSRRYEDGIEASQKVIDEYFDSLSDADRLKTDNSLIFTSFTYYYDSPRLRFMRDHLNDFDSSVKDDVKKRVQDIYKNEACRYLGENLLGDADNKAKYELFKKESSQLGYGDEFKTLFGFVEKRASSDDDTYLAYCDKNFSSLSDDAQSSLVLAVRQVFTTETPEQKKKVSAFIRKYIGSMSAYGVYNAAMSIYSLEK